MPSAPPPPIGGGDGGGGGDRGGDDEEGLRKRLLSRSYVIDLVLIAQTGMGFGKQQISGLILTINETTLQ